MTLSTFFNSKPRSVKYAVPVASLALLVGVGISLKMAFLLSDICKEELKDMTNSLGTKLNIDYLTAETEIYGHDKNVTLTNISAPIPANIVDYLLRAEKRVPGRCFNIPLMICLLATTCTALNLTGIVFLVGFYHDLNEGEAKEQAEGNELGEVAHNELGEVANDVYVRF